MTDRKVEDVSEDYNVSPDFYLNTSWLDDTTGNKNGGRLAERVEHHIVLGVFKLKNGMGDPNRTGRCIYR